MAFPVPLEQFTGTENPGRRGNTYMPYRHNNGKRGSLAPRSVFFADAQPTAVPWATSESVDSSDFIGLSPFLQSGTAPGQQFARPSAQEILGQLSA